MKAGEGYPQVREEEGKLYLLSTERSSSPTGIPGMWGSEFHGKATTFTLHCFHLVWSLSVKKGFVPSLLLSRWEEGWYPP